MVPCSLPLSIAPCLTADLLACPLFLVLRLYGLASRPSLVSRLFRSSWGWHPSARRQCASRCHHWRRTRRFDQNTKSPPAPPLLPGPSPAPLPRAHSAPRARCGRARLNGRSCCAGQPATDRRAPRRCETHLRGATNYQMKPRKSCFDDWLSLLAVLLWRRQTS